MAGGHNKQFLADPRDYFNQHFLLVRANSPLVSQPAGKKEIDLMDCGSGDMVFLEDYNSQQTHGCGAQPIPAYFLPAVYDDSRTLTLGQEVNYLFTPELSGCMFAAYGPDAGHVTVEHVNAKDAGARVPIPTRCQQILSQQYPFCKIVYSGPIPGIGEDLIHTYHGNGAVLGILVNGEWHFYLKADPGKPESVEL